MSSSGAEQVISSFMLAKGSMESTRRELGDLSLRLVLRAVDLCEEFNQVNNRAHVAFNLSAGTLVLLLGT